LILFVKNKPIGYVEAGTEEGDVTDNVSIYDFNHSQCNHSLKGINDH